MAEGDAIVCRAAAGTIAPEPGARLDPKSGFSGACLRTGGIVRCDDSENDPRVNVQVCRRLGTRSIVAVPIASAHGTIGLLEAFSAEPHGFNDSDVRSLKLLAELILAAMKPEEENRLAEISQRLVAGGIRRSSIARSSSESGKPPRRRSVPSASEETRAAESRSSPGDFSGVREETEFHRRPCGDCSAGCSGPGFGSRSVVEVPPLGSGETAGRLPPDPAILFPLGKQPEPSAARTGRRRRTVFRHGRKAFCTNFGDGHMACLVRRLQHRDYRDAGRSSIRSPPSELSGTNLLRPPRHHAGSGHVRQDD